MNVLFVMVPPVWIGLIIAYGVWQRVQTGKPVAPRVPPGAAFGETMCSGRVLRGLLARIGGANNCLIVSVDRGRFVVSLAFPFNLLPIPGLGALDIDVPISTVARVTPGRRLWQHVLRIDFTDINRAPVELVVRDEARLVAALGPRLVQPGADRALQSKSGARLSTRFQRLMLTIVGAGLLIGGGAGVFSDLAVRAHGITTTGVAVGFSGKQALIRYQVDGMPYVMESHINGAWKIGETETVIYLRDNPAQAIEGANLLIALLFMAAGLILLSFGLWWGRLIPGWS
jgi:hypothetical protein